jgi:hypothetical protein
MGQFNEHRISFGEFLAERPTYDEDDAWSGQKYLFYLISLFQLPWLNIVHGIQTRHRIKMDMKEKRK